MPGASSLRGQLLVGYLLINCALALFYMLTCANDINIVYTEVWPTY